MGTSKYNHNTSTVLTSSKTKYTECKKASCLLGELYIDQTINRQNKISYHFSKKSSIPEIWENP